MSAPSKQLKAALAYARRGWPVIPVNGKRPITAHGVHDATTDADTIRAWWAEHPNANVGLAMGYGRVALDVDPRNGGDRTLAELAEQHGVLPATVEALTGGGGQHLIFSTNRTPVGCATLGEGVDVKGARGYIVAAPSVHPDTRKRYAWERSPKHPPADVPEWVTEAMTEARAPAAPTRTDADDAIPKGRRNVALFEPAAGGCRSPG